jgi:hypothetical protein
MRSDKLDKEKAGKITREEYVTQGGGQLALDISIPIVASVRLHFRKNS